MPAIVISEVCKSYRHIQVLNNVSAVFESGKIHGIVGRNGSGKTQLFKCICGYVTPDSGKVLVNGQQIGVDVMYPPRLGLILEQPGFLPQYSGRINLELLMGLSGRLDKSLVKRAVNLVGLQHADNKKVGKYSMGMRQRLGIAQAIMENPDLLILDEPFNGLDETGLNEIRSLLLQLKTEGKTILLASHNPSDIDILCDTVHHMEAGKIAQKR